MTTADLDPKTTRGRRPVPLHASGAAATRRITAQDKAGIALVTVTLIAIMMPFGFWIGTTFLSPSRVLFLFTVPYLGMRLALGHYGPRLITDYMMAAYTLWMMMTLAMHHQAQAVTLSMSNALVVLGGYLAGRVGIRSLDQMQRFARLYGWAVVLMLPVALIDSLSGQVIVAHMLHSLELSWLRPINDVNYPPRLGLYRAQVVFVHPIHFGLFAAFPVGMYFVGLRNVLSAPHRTFMAALIIGTCFLSFSSGPLVAGVFQILLVAYMLATEHLKNQWKLLMWSSGGLYVILELASDRSAIFAIASRVAFNAHNAYVRRTMFEYGVGQIRETPIFGIGFNIPRGMPRWMPDSFDNHWMWVAVANGLPALVFCAVAFLYPMIRAGHGQFRKGSDLYNMRVGWTITMVGLILALATVAVWNQLFSMVFLVLGIGQFMLVQKEPDATAAQDSSPEDSGRGQSRYTRFSGPPARRDRAQPVTDTSALVSSHVSSPVRPSAEAARSMGRSGGGTTAYRRPRKE